MAVIDIRRLASRGIPEDVRLDLKARALNWMREVFEIPDAEWIRGRRKVNDQCPMAATIQAFSEMDVQVYYSRIKYRRPNDDKWTVIRLPNRIQQFPVFFDRSIYPELELHELECEEQEAAMEALCPAS